MLYYSRSHSVIKLLKHWQIQSLSLNTVCDTYSHASLLQVMKHTPILTVFLCCRSHSVIQRMWAWARLPTVTLASWLPAVCATLGLSPSASSAWASLPRWRCWPSGGRLEPRTAWRWSSQCCRWRLPHSVSFGSLGRGSVGRALRTLWSPLSPLWGREYSGDDYHDCFVITPVTTLR